MGELQLFLEEVLQVVRNIVQQVDDVVKRQPDEHALHILLVHQVRVVVIREHQRVNQIEHGVLRHILIHLVVVVILHVQADILQHVIVIV